MGKRVNKTDFIPLYRSGLSCEEIAGKFGVSKSNVSAYLSEMLDSEERKRLRARLTASRSHKSRNEMGKLALVDRLASSEVVERFKAGESLKDIAKDFGLNYHTISERVAKDLSLEERKEIFLRRVTKSRKDTVKRAKKLTPEGLAKMKDRAEERNPNWLGRQGKASSGRARALRKFSIEGKICAHCSNPAQVRHHIDEDPHNNVEENILALCRACHVRLHTKLRYG